MHSITASLLLAIPSIIGAIATPTPDTPTVFSQIFKDGELPIDTSLSIGRAPAQTPPGSISSSSLQKRRHIECWYNHSGARRAQDAYANDCQKLADDMGRSKNNLTLHPKDTASFWTAKKLCKFTVRNQSRCDYATFPETAVAIAVTQTLSRCTAPELKSGWGYIGNRDDLVYIVTRYEASPPAYSPRCGDL